MAIGGWLPTAGPTGAIETSLSPWFSTVLTSANAPWAWWRGEAFRAITALELLASIVAIIAFDTVAPEGHEAAGTVTMTGLTDSRVAAAVVGKGSTSSFPLCLLAMELSSQMESRGLHLDLQWVPRTANEEADRLSNLCFVGFSPERRIDVSPECLPLQVLPLTDPARPLMEAPRLVQTVRSTAKRRKLRDAQPW